MSKIEIKDLYLIFGHEKQKALKMLKKDKSNEPIVTIPGNDDFEEIISDDDLPFN